MGIATREFHRDPASHINMWLDQLVAALDDDEWWTGRSDAPDWPAISAYEPISGFGESMPKIAKRAAWSASRNRFSARWRIFHINFSILSFLFDGAFDAA
jgi:hypothetical protein